MQLFITIVHVLLCLGLILIILLQPGKEGAAAFGGGGGGNQAYGPRGQGNFLGRVTTLVAGLFMVTSITLAYRSTSRTQAGTDDIEDVMKALDAEDAAIAAPPTLRTLPPEPAPEPATPGTENGAQPVVETDAASLPEGALPAGDNGAQPGAEAAAPAAVTGSDN